MGERRRQGKPTLMVLNPEYREFRTTAYTLELTCGKCGKSFRVTKYATPPIAGQTNEEPKNEVIRNIQQTTWFAHSANDKCDGKITDHEIS